MKLPTLYHVSFKNVGSHVWTPRLPAGKAPGDLTTPTKPKGKILQFKEHDTPRICCAETLEGCMMAVYPNIQHYFEDSKYKYPHVDFYYYQARLPRDIGIEQLQSPDVLQQRRYVWDAHITREWDILIPVRMELRGHLRMYNTADRRNWISTHPFGDSDIPKKDVSPPIRYEILERY